MRIRPTRVMLTLLPVTAAMAGAVPAGASLPDGALAAYRFVGGAGGFVQDVVGALAGDATLDLSLGDALDRQPKEGILGPIVPPGGAGPAEWTEDGLRVYGPRVAAATAGPATRLLQALMATNELTLEVVCTPANDEQSGPARIVSLSADPYNRDFTFGQEKDRYVLRLRTTATDANGTPNIETPPGAVRPERQHIAATSTAGKVILYVDGEQVATADRPGDFSTWDQAFPLQFANEATLDRQWGGTLTFAAIYGRALSPDEIAARAALLVPPSAAR